MLLSIKYSFHRDAPEPTGDEGEDADFEAPKVYEPVSHLKLNMPIIFITS